MLLSFRCLPHGFNLSHALLMADSHVLAWHKVLALLNLEKARVLSMTARSRGIALLLLCVLSVQASCSSVKVPDLNELYADAVQYQGPAKNPVVVIPGILGSKLLHEPTATRVWGAFERGAANPSKPQDAKMIALPMQRGKPLRELYDRTKPDGALDRLRVLVLPGFHIEPKAYLNLLLTLGAGGYADQTLGEAGAIDYGDDHYTCFQFDYDWRRSSAENAAMLERFLHEKQAYVMKENRKRFGVSQPVKFDIVAHSMGGLVARYYLRYGSQPLPRSGLPTLNWAGARLVDNVILVGTPNAGASQSLDTLTKGLKVSPFVPRFEPALLGTMPAIYELLPRPRHRVVIDHKSRRPLNLYDINVWERYEWGLANPDQGKVLKDLIPEDSAKQRQNIARDHLHKCLLNARQFHAALDQPASPPPGTKLILFAGDAAETPVLLGAGLREVEVLESGPGDKTVPRYSALMDQDYGKKYDGSPLRSPIDWHYVTFLFENHLGLTKSPTFSDNVLFQLLEQR